MGLFLLQEENNKMNIQINTKDDITENELRYVYYNLKSIKEEYENSWEDRRYKDGEAIWNPWTKELSGIGGIGARVGCKMLVKGRKDTLYFKFKGGN